jgi:hypothetical protein
MKMKTDEDTGAHLRVHPRVPDARAQLVGQAKRREVDHLLLHLLLLKPGTARGWPT